MVSQDAITLFGVPSLKKIIVWGCQLPCSDLLSFDLMRCNISAKIHVLRSITLLSQSFLVCASDLNKLEHFTHQSETIV